MQSSIAKTLLLKEDEELPKVEKRKETRSSFRMLAHSVIETNNSLKTDINMTAIHAAIPTLCASLYSLLLFTE